MKYPNLNKDLVRIILSKLPVKSLIRFKGVSKTWYCLIQNRSFINMHLNRKDHHQYLLLDGSKENRRRDVISFVSYHTMKFSSSQVLQFGSPSIVMGSCDGLLFVVTERCQYVINPATKEFKLLKKLFNVDFSSAFGSYGFGFDPISNDYKLVRITAQRTDLWTLKSNSWRSIPMTNRDLRVMKGVDLDLWSKAVLNNTVHWIGRSEKVLIYTFDIVHEIFGDTIKIPGQYHDHGQDVYYECHNCLVLQDCLSMSILCGLGDIEIWVMKEYGNEESWTKQYRFSFSTSSIDHDICYLKKTMFEFIGVLGVQPLWSPDQVLDFFSSMSEENSNIVDNFKLLLQYADNVFNYRETLVPIF